MRIAILTPTFSSFSGIDRVVELQARGLAEKHDVTIVALAADLPAPRGTKLISLGMPSSSFVERLYRLFFFLDRRKIRLAAKRLEGYDLAISHMYPMNLIAKKAKKYGVRYRFHNHGVADAHLFGTLSERIAIRLFNFLSNRSIKATDEAVSISKYLQGVLKKETGLDSKIEHDVIDRARFNSKVKGVSIRKKYKLKNEPVILYAGRISPHKGVHLLLKAFKLVQREVPAARLVVVGKHTFSNYSQKLKKYAGKNVIFAGYVPDKDLPKYYAACDVYATATLWEGFNLTIAEANACGKPVVAFDIGPHSEVIKRGKLVPAKDVKAFAKAIQKIL